MRALVTGDGAQADRIAALIAAAGWQVARSTTATAARLAGDERLLITVPPAAVSGWQAALDEVALAPARLAQALAAGQPDPLRDASGELRAPGQVIHVLDPAALVPGCSAPAMVAATAALSAALREAALGLAPRLRVNALALGPDADVAPALAWLLGAHAVTGQVISVGADARPPTGWRHAAAK
jgi:hypothetical protein